ncbi:MAG: hypothetical protein IPL71_14080 [Anaerolineales bacterium]|uniref:hypothetical protein n=1 Tax=Candidatus Villigracilis proximus TaxID=3140683 RepID=UPI0031351A9F|nr:hypothetical protein [Anaerolineales bacterium]
MTIGGGKVAAGDAGAVAQAARKIYDKTKLNRRDNILKLYRKPTINGANRNYKTKVCHKHKMI